jgi:uncharacterized membrane protein YjjB (DUF3815 family)
MDLPAILLNALWAGSFAAGLAVIFTAPPRYLFAAFVCGAFGTTVRALATELGLNVNQATVLAATGIVLVGAAFTRRREAPPVVMASGIIPLAASIAVFNTIFLLMRIPAATGDTLNELSVDLSSNVAKVFATSLSIALGLGAGVGVVRLLRRTEATVA